MYFVHLILQVFIMKRARQNNKKSVLITSSISIFNFNYHLLFITFFLQQSNLTYNYELVIMPIVVMYLFLTGWMHQGISMTAPCCLCLTTPTVSWICANECTVYKKKLKTLYLFLKVCNILLSCWKILLIFVLYMIYIYTYKYIYN